MESVGAMGDVGDPAELTLLLSIGRVINDPGTRRAQNTGDRAALNTVIDRVRAILSGEMEQDRRRERS